MSVRIVERANRSLAPGRGGGRVKQVFTVVKTRWGEVVVDANGKRVSKVCGTAGFGAQASELCERMNWAYARALRDQRRK